MRNGSTCTGVVVHVDLCINKRKRKGEKKRERLVHPFRSYIYWKCKKQLGIQIFYQSRALQLVLKLCASRLDPQAWVDNTLSVNPPYANNIDAIK